MSTETESLEILGEDVQLVVTQADDIHPVSRKLMFLADPKVTRNIIWIALAGLILCAVLGVFYPPKKNLPYEEYLPGSWGVLGLIVAGLSIWAAPGLARLLARDEDYYGEDGS